MTGRLIRIENLDPILWRSLIVSVGPNHIEQSFLTSDVALVKQAKEWLGQQITIRTKRKSQFIESASLVKYHKQWKTTI